MSPFTANALFYVADKVMVQSLRSTECRTQHGACPELDVSKVGEGEATRTRSIERDEAVGAELRVSVDESVSMNETMLASQSLDSPRTRVVPRVCIRESCRSPKLQGIWRCCGDDERCPSAPPWGPAAAWRALQHDLIGAGGACSIIRIQWATAHLQ